MDYPIVITALSEEDGGGFFSQAPDLTGCVSDGATRAEALTNIEAAIREWIETAEKRGVPVPAPGSFAARINKERRTLLDVLRTSAAQVEDIEGRVAHMESAIEEIQAQADDQLAWVRFTAITGVGPSREPETRLA